MKLKEWLNKKDEEGISNADAIFGFFWNLMAWSIMIVILLKRG